ncbi:glycerol kinase [Halobacteriovorax marinus SJ]|uniref:Glycerol kinase n=1 Tax=Halobacteriovorax marinus (strain ATCC BAA-682 / DSM 15412 / SJ) TaxID=862908 RepID=E1X1J9_HALMS|nr:glycerol kinase GlpK [Halobacteriovorax marinus]CBW28167.1 glycerol kinase [Halobacteriovorax marinus SJ]
MNYILSIDQGTTGTTAVLIDANTMNFVDKLNKEFPQIFPRPSWVEHNLNDIWETVEHTVKQILKNNNITSDQISSIGITNQRETTCAFKKNGIPLSNAIVWQDRRTSEFCNSLSEKKDYIRKKTGLQLDSYFSGTKMNWLLSNNENVKKAYENKDLLFGTIDTYLLYKLSAGQSHKTEASNASRTLLMDLETTEWCDDLLEIFKVPRETLPEISDSFCNFGVTKDLSFLPDGIPITGILGDQQSALFGQAGLKSGDLKCTYGTGAFMLLNTGTEIKESQHGLLTTVAYKENGVAYYALEGSTYICGAAVQWLRDNLEIIKNSSDIEDLARKVKNLDEMEHVMFLPFFTGIGSPYWSSDAKASILGLTRDTKKEHIARACLDGMALSINDLLQAMALDTNEEIKTLKVDGGAALNELLMNIQSTISQVEIIRPKVIETTAYGAALASAIGAGMIKKEKVLELWKKSDSFHGNKGETSHYEMKKEKWTHYIKALFL